jgi:MoxR-like ATPase
MTIYREQTLPLLGVEGWRHIEPCIVAALVTEAPILLIGKHGTAKSLLLERLAETLNLQFRHYNASTINFDDLVGFPVPENDHIKYLRTPLDAWDAEVLFIDEVSRCRIDMQNRLFSIVHEKKMQGQSLDNLKYRWSAMNPPPLPDHESDHDYIGAEPLDPAFADRYPWVIMIPDTVSHQEQRRIIRGTEYQPEKARKILLKRIQATKGKLEWIQHHYGDLIASYIIAIDAALKHSELQLSLRRQRYIYENIVSLYATYEKPDIHEVCWLALRNSIPHRAYTKVTDEKLLLAHRSALKLVEKEWTETQRKLFFTSDPIERMIIAMQQQDMQLLTVTILDARASLTEDKRLATSQVLFPILAQSFPEAPLVLFESLGEDVARIDSLCASSEMVATYSNRYQRSRIVSQLCAQLQDRETWIEDVMWTAYRNEILIDARDLFDFCRDIGQRLTKNRIFALTDMSGK